MVHGKNRIPYRIDRRLTGLAGPAYHAIISFGLPIEPEDSQYGKYRVGYVGNTHTLILESASTSGAGVPRHRHFYNRLGDLIGGRRLAVAEQSHTRLAARTLGLAAALALRERGRLPLR